MNIFNLIEQLESRVATPREYLIVEDDYRLGYEVAGYLESNQGAPNFRGGVPKSDDQTYETTDFCLVGPGAQKELAEQWNFPLPDDYLEFCSRFSSYFFSGNAYVRIASAEDVMESVIAAREAVDFDSNKKHQFFHFAEVAGEPAYFAFRLASNGEKMDVVYVWDYGDVSVYDLLEDAGDRFVSDLNFTSWLARMIETEGSPLFPGGRWPMAGGDWFDGEPPYLMRLP